MIKIYNKIVESVKPPENKNDIWLNKGVFHIYKQGEWVAFTVDVQTVNKLKEMVEKGVFLIPGEGIIIEDNEINLTLKTVNGESIIGEGNIVIEGGTSNSVESEEIASIEPTPEFPYATRGELTELSTQVSGLSERVDELGQPIFEAKYGETTYDEIAAAKDEGKWVIMIKDRLTYHLSYVAESLAYFATINNNNSYTAYVNKATNGWVEGIKTLEDTKNKTTTISEASTDTQYPSAKAVYDFVQNAGTPSGDPMHYMFEAVGATYNATDEDIPMVGIYGDSYVHKAKHWHLNELGDLTNEEMRVIYSERYPIASNKYMSEWFRQSNGRTTLSALLMTSSISGNSLARESGCETLKLDKEGKEIVVTALGEFCYKSLSCRKILNVINISSLTALSASYGGCVNLEEFRLKGLKANGLGLEYNPKVSKASFLYIIENEAATSAITIKVSNAQYEMLTNDADIQAALAAHPNVSLAK